MCGDLIRHYEQQGARVIVLSEYGIRDVSDAGAHESRAARARAPAVARSWARRCSTLAPARRSPSRTTRSRTSTSMTATRGNEVRAHPRGRARCRAGARRCREGARTGSAMSAPATWSPSRRVRRWFTYYYWLDDRSRPGLRAHGRHPSQARLRSGRAVPRSGHSSPAVDGRLEADEAKGSGSDR